MPCSLPIYTDTYTGLTYIRMSDLPPEEHAAFAKWIDGQTRPWIDGLEPMDAVYVHDYEDYLRYRQGKSILWD